MLFKLSNLNSNLALTLGYLKPALNNSALMKNTTNSHENEKDWTGIAGQLTWCNNNKNRVWNLDEINVRSDDVKVLKSSWNFVKTKTTTPGNNIYTLLITFIAFTSFISSKFQTLFFPIQTLILCHRWPILRLGHLWFHVIFLSITPSTLSLHTLPGPFFYIFTREI